MSQTRSRSIEVFLSVLVFSLFLLAVAPAGAQDELVFDVAEVGQQFLFYPGDLGNNGEVVGWTRVDLPGNTSVAAAAVWYRGTTTVLDVDLTSNSYAEAVNDDGFIVGVIYGQGGEYDRLFLAPPDGPIVDPYLDDLFVGNRQPTAINNTGQVVVRSVPEGESEYRPFLVTGDSDVTPLIPPESLRGEVPALNNFGFTVGYYDVSSDSGTTRQPFLRTGPGEAGEIPIGDPSERAEVADLDDAAHVVGTARLANDGQYRAFIADGGGPLQSLGVLGGSYSEAIAISNHGWIVGNSTVADETAACPFGSTNCHAFIQVGGGAMRDLNELVPADLPWVLTGALDVNDNGQILVIGMPKEIGQMVYLLLSPPGLVDPDPGENLIELIELIEGLGLPKGLENSLLVKLEHAFAAIEDGDLKRACNQLKAFANEVEAQAGKKLTDDQAEELLEGAASVGESLGCG